MTRGWKGAWEFYDMVVLRDFFNQFLASGIIPISLIRWEMTGKDDEIKKLLN